MLIHGESRHLRKLLLTRQTIRRLLLVTLRDTNRKAVVTAFSVFYANKGLHFGKAGLIPFKKA
jgi:hypothetical protein